MRFYHCSSFHLGVTVRFTQSILFAIAAVFLAGTSHGQAKELKYGDKNAEEWVDFVIEEVDRMYAAPVDRSNNVRGENTLLAYLFFADVTEDENDQYLEEYKIFVEGNGSERHKGLLNILEDYEKRVDLSPYMKSNDWIVALAATYLDTNYQYNPARFGRNIRIFEYLMKGHQEDPIYPIAELFLTESKILDAFNKGDIEEYLSLYEYSLDIMRKHIPDLSDKYKAYKELSSMHWFYFNDPVALKLVDKMNESVSYDNANIKRLRNHHGLLELFLGNRDKAHLILKAQEKSGGTAQILYGMSAAAQGDKETALKILATYEPLVDPTGAHFSESAFLKATRAIIELENPTEKDVANWIDIANNHARATRQINYNFFNLSSSDGLAGDNWILNYQGADADINSLYYQGIPLRLESLLEISPEQVDVLKASITNLLARQTPRLVLSDAQQTLHDFFNHQRSDLPLSLELEEKISLSKFDFVLSDTDAEPFQTNSSDRKAILSLKNSIADTYKGDFQSAWRNLYELEKLDFRGSEIEKIINLQSTLQSLKLLSMEGDSLSAFETSVNLLNQKSLNNVQPKEVISDVLTMLAASLNANNHVSSATRVANLDPRLKSDPIALSTQQLILTSWLMILTDNFDGAEQLVKIANDKATQKSDILTAQALSYILQVQQQPYGEVELLKTSVSQAALENAESLDPDNILYYLNYGDLIGADPSDQKGYRNALEQWRLKADQRDRAIRAIQSKAANDRSYVLSQIRTDEIEYLNTSLAGTKRQRFWLAISSFALLIISAILFSNLRRRSALLLDVKRRADESNQKNEVLSYYLNDINSVTQASSKAIEESLTSLERVIENDGLEKVSLTRSLSEEWRHSISGNVIAARILATSEYDAELVKLTELEPRLKGRWSQMAQRQNSFLAYESGVSNSHISIDRFLFDTVTDLVIKDAFMRNKSADVTVKSLLSSANTLSIVIEDKGRTVGNYNARKLPNHNHVVLADGRHGARELKIRMALELLVSKGGSFIQANQPHNSITLNFPTIAPMPPESAAND